MCPAQSIEAKKPTCLAFSHPDWFLPYISVIHGWRVKDTLSIKILILCPPELEFCVLQKEEKKSLKLKFFMINRSFGQIPQMYITMTMYGSYNQFLNLSMTFQDMRKLDFPSKIKQGVDKNSGGHKTLKVAKNNDFTIKNQCQSSNYSKFFKTSSKIGLILPDDTLKTCP